MKRLTCFILLFTSLLAKTEVVCGKAQWPANGLVHLAQQMHIQTSVKGGLLTRQAFDLERCCSMATVAPRSSSTGELFRTPILVRTLHNHKTPSFKLFNASFAKEAWAHQTVEVTSDSIALQSPDSYCKGSNPTLTVTGKNVKWYADAAKQILLHEGNTYSAPSLEQTTVFYVTQTIEAIESAPVPIQITIVELIFVSVVATPAHCGKNDGVISVSATGGSQVRYRLNDGPFQSSSFFTNLAPGTYTVHDSIANCHGSKEVTVSQPETPTISQVTSVDPKCGNKDGALTISAYGGEGGLSYSLNGIDFQADNQFNNLDGGEYTVRVKDKNQCTSTQLVSLKKSTQLRFQAMDVFPTTCGKDNGRLVLTSEGGNGASFYSLDGLTYQLSGSFDSLKTGQYTVSVKDELGCSDTKTVTIAGSEGPRIIHVSRGIPECGTNDGSLKINATGLGPLAYSLNGRDFQGDSSFSYLVSGAYEVTIRDGLNCTASQLVQLGQPCEEAIYLPDSFTPNGDGINDGWAIFFPFPSLQLEELTIYNRWGEVVYYIGSRAVSSGDFLWLGTYKNTTQPGVYTYQLTVQLASGKTHIYRGRLIVIL
ncbi:gliding motility-associated C-terminal domain-containing protein [Spirosoma sp. SC4-14]|uniref:T9SS type B sorting domain-containing protein n=1 Tax=Spirosoma sp. SC4-14 TaxID=3128900 RepID=UPI0030D3BC7E